jgi:hypothetical protein
MYLKHIFGFSIGFDSKSRNWQSGLNWIESRTVNPVTEINAHLCYANSLATGFCNGLITSLVTNTATLPRAHFVGVLNLCHLSFQLFSHAVHQAVQMDIVNFFFPTCNSFVLNSHDAVAKLHYRQGEIIRPVLKFGSVLAKQWTIQLSFGLANSRPNSATK